MTIVIIDRSEPAALRLGSIVSGIKGVRNIIQILDKKHIIETLGKVKPQVILFDVSSNGNEGLLKIQKIREYFPETVIIALASSFVTQYRKKCREIGIEYCLNKISEYDKIPKIISDILKHK
jgi:DNA-binding NarL/FixJ family response regulator